MYGNTVDILKEDSGIFELLVDDNDSNNDSNNKFVLTKQSLSNTIDTGHSIHGNTGLEMQSKWNKAYTCFYSCYSNVQS